MKKIKLLIVSAVLLFAGWSAYGQKSETQFDMMLYGCMVDSLAAHHLDFNQEMDKFEALLIQEKIFESSSKSPCYLFFEKMSKDGKIPHSIDASRFTAVYEVSLKGNLFSRCIAEVGKINTGAVKDSKYVLFGVKVDGLERQENIQANDIARIMTTVFKASDYRKPCYRNPILLSVLSMVYVDVSEDSIKRPEYQGVDDDSTFSVSIRIDAKNELFLNDSLTTKEMLFPSLKMYIMEHKSKNLICFGADKNTSYALYVEIQDLIFAVYKEVKEAESINRYGKKYQLLNETETIEIDKMYPIHIKEPKSKK